MIWSDLIWYRIFGQKVQEYFNQMLLESNLYLTYSARGIRLYTRESDICRRQILPYKVRPRVKRITIFIMTVDMVDP